MNALMEINKFEWRMEIRFNYVSFIKKSMETKNRENDQNIRIKFQKWAEKIELLMSQ